MMNMKIALFEWISGGGMSGCDPKSIAASLRNEGWAMLSTVAAMFQAAGHDVATVIDNRLVSPIQLASVPCCRWFNFDHRSLPDKSSHIENTVQNWLDCVARSCSDLAIVIAPEIDGILERAITLFSQAGIVTLNCSGTLLSNSCDKWLTSERLKAAAIPHPETRLANDFTKLNPVRSKQWCIKPRLGAGCDGLWIGDYQGVVRRAVELPDPTNWIVQPWLEGDAYSCSAIIDRNRVVNWLPLVTQRFDLKASDEAATIVYRGGIGVDPSSGLLPPEGLLNRALRALGQNDGEGLGWIGVDLLLQPDNQWVVIEVNPRFTTSVLGLSQAAPVNLALWILGEESTNRNSEEGSCPSIQDASHAWKNFKFSV
jgi:tyramine---L-glutamate ligase